MLTIHQVSKSYSIQTVLSNVSFSIQAGERLGLIGSNGCGKTTLLKIISGIETADSGTIQVSPSNLRIGYLAQGQEFVENETILSYIHRMEGDILSLTQSLEKLAARLVLKPNDLSLQTEFDAVLKQLTAADQSAGSGAGALKALGLDGLAEDMPVAFLSGGQKTRLALAGVLASNPQLLLLDEPTNHLDLAMLQWLENWLRQFPGGVLMVSHDRAFLDRTASGILELDDKSHALRYYPGNYSDYLDQKFSENSHQWQAYKNQQDEIARLGRAASRVRGQAAYKKGGKADTNDGFMRGFYANRTLETIRRAKQIEKRIESLLSDEHIDKPRQDWQVKIEFNSTNSGGQDVLVIDDLNVGYRDNLLIKEINLVVRNGQRVAITGENGIGKTTLIRTLTSEIPPLSGKFRLGAGVKPGYMAQEQENLNPLLNSLETIQSFHPMSETEARAFLSFYLFTGDDVFVPVRNLSFGERSRLALASLVIRGCNFLLLDEPINHLDIPSRSRFEQALSQFDGTVLAVVHDRYFIDGFASEIWEVKEQKITRYPILI
jgi:ATP-binding cassette subfamily F protein 3